MATEWNSDILHVTYTVFGWIAFLAWACSFYPQLFLNFSRKSVVGLNFNYLLLNNTKQTLYLIYNATLYFSNTVQFQYHKKYGFDQMIPVGANDVASSINAVVLTGMILFQTTIYERGNQSISKITIGIVSVVWITVGVCFFMAFPSNSWLWLIYIFNSMQVILSIIKYIPQVAMNFMLKSTVGFSIGNVFLDLSGGFTNTIQMATQSIDQKSWVNFSGNIGKVMLCTVCMFFDLVFMCQHYVLYPSKKESSITPSKFDDKLKEPFIMSSNQPLTTNVPLAENIV
ncbi:cystinosin homolog [Vicia villosa]|uniref:cystinosin homolog n=1 Tax=Vicia villosa TaxID=3911 RepID=UPI00273B9328|nr:cystinosin homolog [Vicia villosa]